MCHINIINDKSFSILVSSALRTDIGFSPKNDRLVLKEFVPICDFTGSFLLLLLSVGGFCSVFFRASFFYKLTPGLVLTASEIVLPQAARCWTTSSLKQETCFTTLCGERHKLRGEDPPGWRAASRPEARRRRRPGARRQGGRRNACRQPGHVLAAKPSRSGAGSWPGTANFRRWCRVSPASGSYQRRRPGDALPALGLLR